MKLKSCPFCGGKAKIKDGQDIYETSIVCSNCGCGTPIFDEYFSMRDYAVKQMQLGKVNSVCGIIKEATVNRATEVWNRRFSE